MAIYGVTFKDSGETIAIEANHYELRDDFLFFYDGDYGALHEQLALYAADNILQCVKQREYTEAEVLAQVSDGSVSTWDEVQKAGKLMESSSITCKRFADNNREG